MNLVDLALAWQGMPNTDVRVNVGGLLVDVHRVRFDQRRDAIVIELIEEDMAEILTGCRGAGGRACGDGGSAPPWRRSAPET